MKQKIILAGGSGFLGKVLVKYLSDEFDFVILSRQSSKQFSEIISGKRIPVFNWDGKTSGLWQSQLEGAFAVINLSGKSVDCRYNDENKKQIYASRIDSTNAIGNAILQCKNPPKVWINCSSATIYRYSEDKEMNEINGETGEGFSVDVCNKWESAFNKFDLPQSRKIICRCTMVFGKDGGVIPVLKRLVRMGLGGRQGSGNQFVSWMHEKDFADAIRFLLQHENLNGIFNLAAPNPVRNYYFMNVFRKQLKVPFGISQPKWLLEIGAFLLRTETELILKSRRVVPGRLLNAGFRFSYPDIQNALSDIL